MCEWFLNLIIVKPPQTPLKEWEVFYFPALGTLTVYYPPLVTLMPVSLVLNCFVQIVSFLDKTHNPIHRKATASSLWLFS